VELRGVLKSLAQSQAGPVQIGDELRAEFRLLTRTIAAAMEAKRG
jgi:hypothetical protein